MTARIAPAARTLTAPALLAAGLPKETRSNTRIFDWEQAVFPIDFLKGLKEQEFAFPEEEGGYALRRLVPARVESIDGSVQEADTSAHLINGAEYRVLGSWTRGQEGRTKRRHLLEVNQQHAPGLLLVHLEDEQSLQVLALPVHTPWANIQRVKAPERAQAMAELLAGVLYSPSTMCPHSEAALFFGTGIFERLLVDADHLLDPEVSARACGEAQPRWEHQAGPTFYGPFGSMDLYFERNGGAGRFIVRNGPRPEDQASLAGEDWFRWPVAQEIVRRSRL